MSTAVATIAAEQQNTILSHVLNSLRSSEMSNKPFSHLYATSFFPEGFYRDLLNHLPDSADYSPMAPDKRLADGTFTRTFYQLDNQGLRALAKPARSLWSTVADVLLSDEFKRGVFTLLKQDLAYRFSIREDEVESLDGSPRLRLIRDISGYAIAPHPDTRKKIVTMMIYLPSDYTQADLGTSLYALRLSVKGLKSKSAWFKEVKRFPFHPNSSFAFAVNNTFRKKSWHGRELIPARSGVRHSLVTTFYRPGTVD